MNRVAKTCTVPCSNSIGPVPRQLYGEGAALTRMAFDIYLTAVSLGNVPAYCVAPPVGIVKKPQISFGSD